MPQADRKLVPIVSLDVVGYSRLVDHSEHQTLRLVRTVYEVLIRGTITRPQMPPRAATHRITGCAG